MNPTTRNFSISTLMVANLDGCSGRCFLRTDVMSGQVLMQCLTIEGSRPGISMDQGQTSLCMTKQKYLVIFLEEVFIGGDFLRSA
jgi:hypothetical protein